MPKALPRHSFARAIAVVSVALPFLASIDVHVSSALPACTPTSATNGLRTVLKFESTMACDWSAPASVTSLDVMAVGAGGGGGGDGGDGGGGGELREASISITSSDVLSITAGTGGSGGQWSTNTNGADGSASSIVIGASTRIRANGGMGGSNFNWTSGGQGVGGSGGSGGTGSNGGNGGSNSNSNPVIQGTSGANGPTSSITGTSTNYGGGGGGGIFLSAPSDSNRASLTGGLGGGGRGASHTQNVGDSLGTQGVDGKGGGGGGGSAGNGATETSSPSNNEVARLLPGMRGGHGVVFISYVTPVATTTSTTTTTSSTTTITTTTTSVAPVGIRATTTTSSTSTTISTPRLAVVAPSPTTTTAVATTTTSTNPPAAPSTSVRNSALPITSTQTTTAPQVMPRSADLFTSVDTTPEFFDVALETSQTAGISDSRVSGKAVGLLPGSTIRIVMHSDPIELGEVTVDPSGSAAFDFPLPANAPEGEHSITVEGKSNSNEPITAITTFTVTEAGTIDNIVAPTEVMGADIEALNIEGSQQFGVPVYDPTRNVGQTAAIATTAVLVTSLVGAGMSSMGMTMSPTSGSQPTSTQSTGSQNRAARREDDDASADGENSDASNSEEDTNEDTEGSFSSTDANALRLAKQETVGLGDKKQTWVTQGFPLVDRVVRSLVRTFSPRSVLITRIAQDGHWLRTAFGSVSGLVWIAGIIAGAASAIDTNFRVGLPATYLALGIIALSMIDAFASTLAWLTFAIACIATGHVTNIYEFRTLMGLAIIWIALPSIASAIRPIVRPREKTLSYTYERIADYVVMTLFASYAASSAFSALNGLSGLTLVTSQSANQVRILMAVCCILRLLAEDAIQILYPKRSAEIFVESLTKQSRSYRVFMIALSAVLYLIASGPFFGLGWRTWMVISFMSAVPLAKLFASSLPNFPRIHRWFPRGIVRSVAMIFVSAWFARFIFNMAGEAHHAQTLAVLLLIPGIVIGFIDCVARDGGQWPSSLFTKISGAALWLFLAAVLTGNIAI